MKGTATPPTKMSPNPERTRLALDLVRREHYGEPSVQDPKSTTRFATEHGTQESTKKRADELKSRINWIDNVLLPDLETQHIFAQALGEANEPELRNKITLAKKTMSTYNNKLRQFRINSVTALRKRDSLSRKPI